MAVIYATINSKGISCFPKAHHGSVAGVILFFTCVAAAVGPLALGIIGDLFGDIKYGFILATIAAAMLCLGLILNCFFDPTKQLVIARDQADYGRRKSSIRPPTA
jgi:fucose permease